MKKFFAILSVFALVACMSTVAMAAKGVDNNGKPITVADGVTIVSGNNKGTKEVTVTISEGAAEGELTVYYGNNKPQDSKTFDTSVPTSWSVGVKNGDVSYDWVSFWNYGVVVAPNCCQYGYTYDEYVPTGQKWYYDYTDPLGHDFGAWADLDFSQPRLDVVSDYNSATVIDPVGTCSVCGWSGYIYASITAEEIYVPTCTTHGLIEYTATLIDWSGYSVDYNYILAIWSNPLGHDMDSYCNICELCDICGPCGGHVTFLEKLDEAAFGLQYSVGPITVTVDGVEYTFATSNGKYNQGGGGLCCTVNGVEYGLNIHGNTHVETGVTIKR